MKSRPKYFIAVSRKEYVRRMWAKFRRSRAAEKPPKNAAPPPDHQWDERGMKCKICGATGGPDSWQGVDPCVRPRLQP